MTTATAEVDDVLDALDRSVEQQEQEAAVRYWELVTALADGQAPDPEVVRDVLRCLGKTTGDMRSAVALMQRRRGMLAQIDQANAMELERPAITAALKAADDKLNEAERIHEMEVGPLYQRQREITAAVQSVDGIQQDLRRSCPYANVQQRLNAINSSIEINRKSNSEWVREVERLEKILESGTADHGQQRTIPELIAQKRRAMAPADARIAALYAERDQITSLQYKP